MELREGSKQLGKGHASDQNNFAAYRLMAQNKFDAKKLNEQIKTTVIDVSSPFIYYVSDTHVPAA